ncbi:hypothetical protein BDAP_000544 [Binucleata daphniae]
MQTLKVDNKLYDIHSNLLDVVNYKNQNIIFTERSIIFTNCFSYTVHLKPYNYFVSKKHGIIVQEKDTLLIKQIKNAFAIPKIIMEAQNILLGIFKDDFVFFSNDHLILQNIENLNNKQELKSNFEVDKIVMYNETIVAISKSKIAFKNNALQITFNLKNKGNVHFESLFLVIDDFMFYNETYVGKKVNKIEITKFEEEVLLNFEKQEFIDFFKRYFASKNSICEVFYSFTTSKQTIAKINNLLIGKILSNKLLFDEKIVQTCFFKLPIYILHALDNNKRYKKVVHCDFILQDLDTAKNNDAVYSITRESSKYALDDKCNTKSLATFFINSSFCDSFVNQTQHDIENNSNDVVEYNTISDTKNIIKTNFENQYSIKNGLGEYICITENTIKTNETLVYSIIKANETLKRKNIVEIKAGNEYFDKSIDEVDNLLNENQIGVFLYDENDLEKKRKIAFVNKICANIGKSFYTYKTCKIASTMRIKNLKIKIKSQQIETAEIEKIYKNWPDLFFMCNKMLEEHKLEINNLQNIFHIEDVIQENYKHNTTKNNDSTSKVSIPFSKFDHDFLLAGALFGMGLRGEITEQMYLHYYFSTKDVVVFAIIIGYCISIKGSKQMCVYETLKSNITENDTYLCKIGSILGLGFLFYESDRKDIAQILVNECNANGVFTSDSNRNHKKYYDEFYRYFSVFSLSLTYKNDLKFVSLNDKMCELLLNGLVFIGTRNKRILYELKRNEDAKYEELFYSSLFLELCMLETDSLSIINEININSMTLSDAYKLSGKIFYIAFKELKDILDGITRNVELYNKLLELCLIAEEKMQENENLRLIFDYLLITLSIIQNGTCDLNVLRILRRLIKQSENSKFLDTKEFFSLSSCKDEKVFGLLYGQTVKYKMCLGILCLGKGTKKFRFSKNMIRNTIISFFINFPLTPADQEYFNILRYFICFDIADNNESKQKNEKNAVLYKNSIGSDLEECFTANFNEMNKYNQKISLDVLCDYFEKNDDFLDFSFLPKFASDFFVNKGN